MYQSISITEVQKDSIENGIIDVVKNPAPCTCLINTCGVNKMTYRKMKAQKDYRVWKGGDTQNVGHSIFIRGMDEILSLGLHEGVGGKEMGTQGRRCPALKQSYKATKKASPYI